MKNNIELLERGAVPEGAISRQPNHTANGAGNSPVPQTFDNCANGMSSFQHHTHAVEAAYLANIVGRARVAALVLAALGAIAIGAGSGSMPPTSLVLWAFLIAAAAVELFIIYFRAAHAAFNLTVFRALAADLNLAMLLAGFAWGAGAFLGVAQEAGAAGLIVLAVSGTGTMAAVLRSPAAALYFLFPGVGSSLAATLTQSQDLVSASLLLAFAVLMMIAGRALSRRVARRRGWPLGPITFS